MRVITANLNGIRSALGKGFFDWMVRQDADVVCVQEIRIQDAQLTRRMRAPGRYRGWFHFAEQPGYSGVAIYSRVEPDAVHTGIGWDEGDREGRLLRLDFGATSVSSLYLPSGSSSEARQAFKYRYMDALYDWLCARARDGRQHLVCGDWNIAHREIDLKNWRSNRKTSGFLPEERQWMSRVFDEAGMVDTHRRLAPEAGAEAYTWWSNRGRAWENNVGWRLDYQVATPQLAAQATGWKVYKRKRYSDHAPLVLDYDT
ncbi:MAG TPA: exodeoxyribonuclease III [Planctomycetota bacterium]